MRIASVKTGRYGERPLTKVRLFLSTKDERVENLTDRLMGFRHRSPYKTYREQVLPKVFTQLGIAPKSVKWSQKAGCSCGCSPGYLLELNPEDTGFEAIWVTISDTKSRKLKE